MPVLLLTIFICLAVLINLAGLLLIFNHGKTYASKSDIHLITDILNQLYERNIQENDLLKANLSIYTGQNNHIFNERKKAILDFFSCLNTWMWDGLNISVQEYNHVNFEDITKRINDIKNYYNKTNITFAVMQLTIDAEHLVKTGYEAMMDTLKLHHFVENTMKSYQKTLSWEKTLLDKITSKDYDFFKLSPDMKGFYERQALENEEEKRRTLEGYNDRHWELFKQAIADRNLFRDLAKKEIERLEKNIYSKEEDNSENFIPNGLSNLSGNSEFEPSARSRQFDFTH